MASVGRKRGCAESLVRTNVDVSVEGGDKIQAITYTVAEDRRQAHVVPHQNYVDVVCEGLNQWGLDYSHILKAVQNNA